MTNELQRYYSDLREKNLRLHEARVAECDRMSPRFRSLQKERALVFRQLSRGKLNTAAAKSRIGAISAEEKTTLIALGLPANYLEPIYTCPKCMDTGEVGDLLKKPCACALKRMQETERAGSRINDRETFAAFDESLYTDSEQKRQALGMRRFSERYAAALPAPEKPNLLILGQSGLGKSYFGNAIAHAAIEKGVRTIKATAYQCIQSVLDGIDRREEGIAPYLRVPLLVLDDLGTEAMMPNVTVETVFRILNERAADRLPTVLISNLDREGLFERYGERVASRMIDGSLTSIVVLQGENLRTRVR
jgi:DNA replication protein DnaC